MAVSKYIQQVQKAALGRPKSTEWYRDKIKELRSILNENLSDRL